MENLVPLPYSRIAVQNVAFELIAPQLIAFLRGREAWFETDYVVFRRGDESAVAHIGKAASAKLFQRITDVEVISLPDSTLWVDDPAVDAGSPSALAEKALALGTGPLETLVVCGLYEHVGFIHRPQPLVIDVFDLSPPDPPRLLDMARRVLASRSFPAVILRPHIQQIPELTSGVTDKALLFPCGISQFKRTMKAYYLDERPTRQDWVLVGCERSRQIHRHFYQNDCSRIELCPRKLFDPAGALALMRCCMVEKGVDLAGRVAFVPWGADPSLIEQALASLLDVVGKLPHPSFRADDLEKSSA